MNENEKFMIIAAKEAQDGVNSGDGGPFGAVVVREGEIIAKAHNMVLKNNDPTAHAEIMAIRKAAEILGRFDLSDCVIFSSCEPCPMCFSAIHWAKIPKLYYGLSADDAAEIGFDDKLIYDTIKKTVAKPRIESSQIFREVCMPAFDIWKSMKDKTHY